VKAKGEITLVVAGSTEEHAPCAENVIEEELERLLNEGMSERDAVRDVAARFPVPKKEIYRRMLETKGEQEGE
jgi:16S rRNA (cytidine1402-2'-O)-methyltransferase